MSCWAKSLKAAKNLVVLLASIGFSLSTSPAAQVQQGQGSATLFENVRIFDGKSDALSGPKNFVVIMKDGKIYKNLLVGTGGK
jgi:hypothetical protein